MAYVEGNPKTKRELFARFAKASAKGRSLYAFQPGGLFGLRTGRTTLEGPHYPEPHRWYCAATVDDNGAITKLDGFDAWARAEARKASGEAPTTKRRASRRDFDAWRRTCTTRPSYVDPAEATECVRYFHVCAHGGGFTRKLRCTRCGDTLGAFMDREDARNAK